MDHVEETGHAAGHENHSPYIVFSVAGQAYALSHAHVKEMVQPPPVVSVPHAPHAVRGVINLRGNVMGVVDFRMAIGLASASDETNGLIEELVKREEEHRAWLAELEASILENREFRKTTDPHACAFGRWFDGFSTSNLLLSQTVERFGAPHQRIHGIAKKATALRDAGDRQGAVDLISQTRNGDLATMITLFAETKTLLRTLNREIAIIVGLSDGASVALMVDSVDSIRTLEVHDDADLGEVGSHGAASAIVSGVASITGDDLVLIVDPESLLPILNGLKASAA